MLHSRQARPSPQQSLAFAASQVQNEAEAWELLRSALRASRSNPAFPPRDVYGTLAEGLPHVPARLLGEVLSRAPETGPLWLANSALGQEGARRVSEWALEEIELAAGRGGRIPHDPVSTLRVACRRGHLAGGSAPIRRALSLLEDLALPLLRSGGEAPRAVLHKLHQVASPLLSATTLEEAEALKILRLAGATLDVEDFEEMVLLPSATPHLWEQVAQSRPDLRRPLARIFRQIPGARTHPALRALLREERSDPEILAALCLEGEEEAPHLFQELARLDLRRAAQLLDDPEFRSRSFLRLEDLAPVLAIPDAGLRLKAIRAAGAIAQGQTEALPPEAVASWRERYRPIPLNA